MVLDFVLKIRTTKVEWPVTEHLSAQGRPDPRGGVCCFWCPNKIWTSPLEASGTLTIVKNGSEMRKLQPPKVQRVENSKKQTT